VASPAVGDPSKFRQASSPLSWEIRLLGWEREGLRESLDWEAALPLCCLAYSKPAKLFLDLGDACLALWCVGMATVWPDFSGRTEF
jgi:hypothetical protein